MNCVHCSICEAGASFVVIRHGKREPLCEQHWEWLVENSSQIPVFIRITPCSCQPPKRGPRKKRVRLTTEESLQKKRAQKRDYYQRNRDRCAAYTARYHRENKEKVAAMKRRHYEANQERIRAAQRAYGMRKRAEERAARGQCA